MLKQICERDNRDMTRSDAPLRQPAWAYVVDTTHIDREEQVERIYDIVQDVLQNKKIS